MSNDTKACIGMTIIAALTTYFGWVGLAHGATPTEKAMLSLGVASPSIPELAAAIDAATENKAGRALLISVAWHESRFEPDVIDCRKTGDSGRAVGAFQSWNLVCPVSVGDQAKEAIRHLKSARAYCKGRDMQDQMERAVSLYATGKTCSWPGAKKRWRTMVRVFPHL